MLTDLLDALRSSSGLDQKARLQSVSKLLSNAHPCPYPNGDDAAIIPRPDGYDLLAGEGFIDEFVEHDPWFSGWCGVMVNISDIAAMGGTPTAIVDMVWGAEDEATERLLEGMAAASHTFQVPIVGGHTNLRNSPPRLGVSIFGRANKVLSSFNAKPGQKLVAAIDLRGQYQKPFNNWNAATLAPPERLRGDIALLPKIADQELAVSAKDISQAGLLGTLVMLLESAQVGADVLLDRIPKPEPVEWLQWLDSFPSFGYLLTCEKEKLDQLLGLFEDRNIHAACIGELNDSLKCNVNHAGESACFWDLKDAPLTSMGIKNA